MANDLAERPVTPITEMARAAFQEEQVAVIRDTVAADCSPAELHMFLEIAARHRLDPFLGEIYAAKMGGRDGGTGRVTIMVPRDGFLAVAQRNDDFEGMDGDVVREKDEFTVMRVSGGREVEHTYTGSDKDRGPILGAWAMVYRRGRKPTYFYASIEEYKPPPGKKLDYSPWSKQESAMILKCAESTCLRKAFSITGVAGAEEMERVRVEAVQHPGADPNEVEWGDNPILAEQLRAYFNAMNELQPGAYKPAKVRVMMRGKSEDERREIVEQLAEEIEAAGGSLPEPEEPVEEEIVEDATVVDEEGNEIAQEEDEGPGPEEDPPEDAEEPQEAEEPAEDPS